MDRLIVDDQQRGVLPCEQEVVWTGFRMAWLVMVFLLRDLRVNRLRPGICCTVTASGGLCESEKFQEIVGGADHGPLGTYFLDAAQQELAEAAWLFDLSEHRLTTCFLNR